MLAWTESNQIINTCFYNANIFDKIKSFHKLLSAHARKTLMFCVSRYRDREGGGTNLSSITDCRRFVTDGEEEEEEEKEDTKQSGYHACLLPRYVLTLGNKVILYCIVFHLGSEPERGGETEGERGRERGRG